MEKTLRIGITIPTDILAYVDAKAQREERTRSRMIALMIDGYREADKTSAERATMPSSTPKH